MLLSSPVKAVTEIPGKDPAKREDPLERQREFDDLVTGFLT